MKDLDYEHNCQILSNENKIIIEKLCLDKILDYCHITLREGFSICEFFPKIFQRFNGNSLLIYNKFPVYKILNNIFECCILEKKDSDYFYENYLNRVKPLEEKNVDNIISYLKDYNALYIYKEFKKFFSNKNLKFLRNLIEENKRYDFLEEIWNHLHKGKDILLTSFLSSVSIIYGLREFRKNIFIFYYQPYYDEIPEIGEVLVKACRENLSECHKLVFSFRFVDPIFKNKTCAVSFQNYLEEINLRNKVCLSYLGNVIDETLEDSFLKGFRKLDPSDDLYL